MKGMQDILKQAQKMQVRMAQMQEELENLEVEGTAGGGKVTVKANGKGEIISLKINPEAVDTKNVEMLEGMILDAVKDALSKSTKLAQKKMSQAAGGFPGMGLMGKMGFPGF